MKVLKEKMGKTVVVLSEEDLSTCDRVTGSPFPFCFFALHAADRLALTSLSRSSACGWLPN